MIKEIMLASAVLTNSMNSNIYYNLENFSNNIHIVVNHAHYSSELGEYAIVYNLSNGNIDFVTYVVNDSMPGVDGYEIDIYESFTSAPTYISDYFIYNCNDVLGFIDGVPMFTDYAYAEFLTLLHFSGINIFDEDNSEANLSYQLCMKDSRNNVLMGLSDTDYISLYGPNYGLGYTQDNDSELFGNSYISLYNLMSGTFSIDTSPEDYVLLFQFHELYYSESSTFVLDFINPLSSYEFYYALLNGYEEGYSNLWTDFIYSNVSDYEQIVERNEYLTAENNRLNSEHVFNNIFEIVRGAIDGVVNFMTIELMPNLTIGSLFFVPVVIGVIWFILKALVL